MQRNQEELRKTLADFKAPQQFEMDLSDEGEPEVERITTHQLVDDLLNDMHEV